MQQNLAKKLLFANFILWMTHLLYQFAQAPGWVSAWSGTEERRQQGCQHYSIPDERNGYRSLSSLLIKRVDGLCPSTRAYF